MLVDLGSWEKRSRLYFLQYANVNVDTSFSTLKDLSLHSPMNRFKEPIIKNLRDPGQARCERNLNYFHNFQNPKNPSFVHTFFDTCACILEDAYVGYWAYTHIQGLVELFMEIFSQKIECKSIPYECEMVFFFLISVWDGFAHI